MTNLAMALGIFHSLSLSESLKLLAEEEDEDEEHEEEEEEEDELESELDSLSQLNLSLRLLDFLWPLDGERGRLEARCRSPADLRTGDRGRLSEDWRTVTGERWREIGD